MIYIEPRNSNSVGANELDKCIDAAEQCVKYFCFINSIQVPKTNSHTEELFSVSNICAMYWFNIFLSLKQIVECCNKQTAENLNGIIIQLLLDSRLTNILTSYISLTEVPRIAKNEAILRQFKNVRNMLVHPNELDCSYYIYHEVAYEKTGYTIEIRKKLNVFLNTGNTEFNTLSATYQTQNTVNISKLIIDASREYLKAFTKRLSSEHFEGSYNQHLSEVKIHFSHLV